MKGDRTAFSQGNGTVTQGWCRGASRSTMKGAVIIADLIVARKERNAVATEWQGVHGNAMSKAMPTRGAKGATWVLSSAVLETMQRASRGQASRDIRMQTPRHFPSNEESKKGKRTLPTSATQPSAQNFADALGLPRRIHCRNITGGAEAANSQVGD